MIQKVCRLLFCFFVVFKIECRCQVRWLAISNNYDVWEITMNYSGNDFWHYTGLLLDLSTHYAFTHYSINYYVYYMSLKFIMSSYSLEFRFQVQYFQMTITYKVKNFFYHGNHKSVQCLIPAVHNKFLL